MDLISSYLHILACPSCHSNLKKFGNKLLCCSCQKIYPLKNDIPILIDLKKLPQHFQKQISYFEQDSLKYNYQLKWWQKSYINRLENNFKLNKKSVLVDIGTGSGYIALEMAKRGLQVIACDLTFKSLILLKKITQKKNLENKLFLVCCSAEYLPLKDEIADYIVANAVLEHLPQEKKSIDEINRISKKNADLMVTVPLKYKHLNPLLIPVNYIHDKRIGHLRRYDKDTLLKKFNYWSLSKIYYTGHFPKVMKILINFLIKIFDDKSIEEEDQKKEKKRWGASNIVCFLKKCVSKK